MSVMARRAGRRVGAAASASRRALLCRTTIAALTAALLAGCVSVSVGTADAPAMTYYVLADARQRPAAVAPAEAPRLAIHAAGSDAVADSTVLAFSRRPGERAFYQFASWTERPSRRLAVLAQRRLEAGGRFSSVTQVGQPVGADWLLTLGLESLVHDVSVTPGRAEIVLRAELVRRSDRARVAQRAFAVAAPVAEASAPAAVAAFAVAVADALDQLAEWTESAVATAAAR